MSQVSKRAKTLTPDQFAALVGYLDASSSDALRDHVIFALSYKAGLRVGEIAGLRWLDVVDVSGVIRSDGFEVPANIAKKGSGRSIPMHGTVHAALVALAARDWKNRDGTPRPRKMVLRSPIVAGPHGKHVSPNTLQRYISRTYENMGFVGCSSHSGRRTFVTTLAQIANQHDCSLRDVQRLAGHRDIETTELYIEASKNVGALVRSL